MRPHMRGVMIEKRAPTFGSLIGLAGPMVAVCLICSAAILVLSYATEQNSAGFLLLVTAFKLAYTPREKFIDRKTPWSPASVRYERSLIVMALVLYFLTCAATLVALWFVLPFTHASMPIKASIAATAGLAAGIWCWLQASRRWSVYDRTDVDLSE